MQLLSMCVFGYLIWLTASHSFQLDWLTACMFHLDLDSPLLLFQIKSVETRLPCCAVHWLGAAGDIWPTGPHVKSKHTGVTAILHQAIIDVEDIDRIVQERRNSIANALELRLSCTNPGFLIDMNFQDFLAFNFPARYAHTTDGINGLMGLRADSLWREGQSRTQPLSVLCRGQQCWCRKVDVPRPLRLCCTCSPDGHR